MRKTKWLMLSLVLLLSACAAGAPLQTPRASPLALPTADDALQEVPSPLGEQSPATLQSAPLPRNVVWLCYSCGSNQVWVLEHGQAKPMTLPVEAGVIFDYIPATGRILYASRFPDQGGGPGEVSVTDLWVFEMTSGQAAPIFNEEKIVEAVWAPDGEHFVYVLATPETYELRWRALSGEDGRTQKATGPLRDRLLASDVAFTFSVSPNGEQVAFTRESNYEVAGPPGFFVTNVATGDERQLSDVDRAGAGAIEDRPVWSPDGNYVALPVSAIADRGEPASPYWLRAAVDGSDTTMIEFDDSLADEAWYEVAPYSLVWPETRQLIGTTFLITPDAQLGGKPHVIRYQLNNNLDTVIDGALVAEGILLGVNIPGGSVWVYRDEEVQSIPLLAP